MTFLKRCLLAKTSGNLLGIWSGRAASTPAPEVWNGSYTVLITHPDLDRNPSRDTLTCCSGLVTQLCPCYPMDCRLPGSSVHGIFQARRLEWVVISFSRGSSRVSCIAERFFTAEAPGKLDIFLYCSQLAPGQRNGRMGSWKLKGPNSADCTGPWNRKLRTGKGHSAQNGLCQGPLFTCLSYLI